MGDQTSSCDYIEGDFIINSGLLVQPLMGLEKVLFNITKNIPKKPINRVDIYNAIEAYIEMDVLVKFWAEERCADRPNFMGRYSFSLKLLDPLSLKLLNPTGREIVSCVASGGISQSDIKITCLENDSSYESLYPMENFRNSLLDISYLIHRRVRGIFKDPDMRIDNKALISYDLDIKASIYLTQKPDVPRIEVYNSTPVFGTFRYDNKRSKIIIVYEPIIPGYWFLIL